MRMTSRKISLFFILTMQLSEPIFFFQPLNHTPALCIKKLYSKLSTKIIQSEKMHCLHFSSHGNNTPKGMRFPFHVLGIHCGSYLFPSMVFLNMRTGSHSHLSHQRIKQTHEPFGVCLFAKNYEKAPVSKVLKSPISICICLLVHAQGGVAGEDCKFDIH